MNKVSLIYTRTRIWWKINSHIIAWRIRRPYSHVAIVFYSPWLGMDLVIQASHGMVHVVPLQFMSRENKVVQQYDLCLTDAEISRGIRWAVNMTGRKYSVWAAIAATIPFLRSLQIGQDGDHEFICSEFVARFLEESKGVSLQHMRGADDYIDPSMIEDLVRGLAAETK